MSAIGLDLTVITWLVGMVGAVIVIVAAFVFNLQKWVIIVATSVMGAVTIAGTFGLLFSPSARMIEQPVQAVVRASPLLIVVALLVAAAGIVVQARVNRFYEIQAYNRWEQATA
jgi:nitrate reductase gamma subunit